MKIWRHKPVCDRLFLCKPQACLQAVFSTGKILLITVNPLINVNIRSYTVQNSSASYLRPFALIEPFPVGHYFTL